MTETGRMLRYLRFIYIPWKSDSELATRYSRIRFLSNLAVTLHGTNIAPVPKGNSSSNPSVSGAMLEGTEPHHSPKKKRPQREVENSFRGCMAIKPYPFFGFPGGRCRIG